MHGVCLRSSYKAGEYEWINNDVVPALKEIMRCPHSKIILWSSCYEHEQEKIIKFFNDSGVQVDFFNENPMFANTEYGCFDQKFYFSILIDDKAGFDPDTEWKMINDFLTERNVVVFPHKLLHQGATVISGTKYAIRSDAMYEDHKYNGEKNDK